MADILLPRWIIANRNMPGGLRTSKKPVFVFPNPEQPKGTIREKWMSYIKGVVAGFKPYEEPHVFEGWEYRFWAAQHFSNGVYTECRACGFEQGKSMTDRRKHHDAGDCATHLVSAYKLLLRDMVCVICDMKSHKSKWGVPLCGDSCVQAWCESEAQPSSLTGALLMTGMGVKR